jgi:hypothetical protein
MGSPQYHPNPRKTKDTWMLAIKKRERIAGLTGLLKTWEELHPDETRYIKALKWKLLVTQRELDHMKV